MIFKQLKSTIKNFCLDIIQMLYFSQIRKSLMLDSNHLSFKVNNSSSKHKKSQSIEPFNQDELILLFILLPVKFSLVLIYYTILKDQLQPLSFHCFQIFEIFIQLLSYTSELDEFSYCRLLELNFLLYFRRLQEQIKTNLPFIMQQNQDLKVLFLQLSLCKLKNLVMNHQQVDQEKVCAFLPLLFQMHYQFFFHQHLYQTINALQQHLQEGLPIKHLQYSFQCCIFPIFYPFRTYIIIFIYQIQIQIISSMLQRLKQLAGTPAKKIKLNQLQQKRLSTKDEQYQNDLINNIVFVRNLSKKQSCHQKSKDQVQTSSFSYGQQLPQNQQLVVKNQKMPQFQIISQRPAQEQYQSLPKKLKKKITINQIRMDIEYDNILEQLTLNKNNSTFPTKNQIQLQQFLGDNIYINQLKKSQKRDNNSKNSKINEIKQYLIKSGSNTSDIQGRLKTDYQIKQNMKSQFEYKQAYLCLNKLQKIFYFVKKMQFGQEYFTSFQDHAKQSDKSIINLPSFSLIKRLSNDQIKLFTKDTDNHLVRFYQQWVQNNSLFMIFQISSYTLIDKNCNCLRLAESEIWSLISQCSNSLKWIYNKNSVHLNIKPGNILKCRNKFKLADPFVTSQNFRELFQENSQSYIYTDPDIIKFIKYLNGFNFIKSDIYSLGMCIIQNILNLPFLVFSKCKHEEIKKLLKKNSHGYSPYLIRLLIKMIDKRSNKRPSIEELCGFAATSSYESFDNTDKTKLKFKRNYSL